MPDETPHFLRFARAIALVGSVTVVGCSSTAVGQDVPAADQAGDVTSGSDTPPPPGIVVAPDAPDDRPVMVDAGVIVAPDGPPPGLADAPDAPADQPVMIDAGISVSPDGPLPGVVVAPDAPDEDAPADGGVIFRPDGPLPGVIVAPDAPAFGALETAPGEDDVA